MQAANTCGACAKAQAVSAACQQRTLGLGAKTQ